LVKGVVFVVWILNKGVAEGAVFGLLCVILSFYSKISISVKNQLRTSKVSFLFTVIHLSLPKLQTFLTEHLSIYILSTDG